jgi:hypothetical protein
LDIERKDEEELGKYHVMKMELKALEIIFFLLHPQHETSMLTLGNQTGSTWRGPEDIGKK